MNKRIACLLLIAVAISASAIAQKSVINRADFNNAIQKITTLLPGSWILRTDTSHPDEILLQSQVTDLESDMTSNDAGFGIEGQCEIYILMLPHLSPDSITIIRDRNLKLKEALPPQNSKNDLKKWYVQNAKTLKILDAEPTNYDEKYSYRIKCQRAPKPEADKKQYEYIMAELNKLFKKYSD